MPHALITAAKMAGRTLPGAIGVACLMIPLSAAAQAVFGGGGLAAGLAAMTGVVGVATGSLPGVIDETVSRVILYLGMIATIVIIIAGFYLILGLGDEGSKDKAKKIIMYTIIGMAVVIFAKLIVSFAMLIITGTGTDAAPTVWEVVERIVAYVALIATIVIIIAGFYLILGLGDEGSKDKAKKIILYTIVGIIIIGLAAVIVATVFYILTGEGDGQAIKDVIAQFVRKVLNYLALIAVITIIIAGFYLVLSLGDEGAKDKAKKIITYTLVGLIIILFARLIVGIATDVVADAVTYLPSFLA